MGDELSQILGGIILLAGLQVTCCLIWHLWVWTGKPTPPPWLDPWWLIERRRLRRLIKDVEQIEAGIKSEKTVKGKNDE